MGSVWLYGNARYDAGINKERASCAVLNAKAGQQATKDWQDIEKHLISTSKNDDLDYLRSLGGIVRSE